MKSFSDVWEEEKQLTAALNLLAVLVGDDDLSHYPMVRDVLIPHKKIAKEVIDGNVKNDIAIDHAVELIEWLDRLDAKYNNRV